MKPTLKIFENYSSHIEDISKMAIVRDIRDQYIDTNNPPASSAVEVRKLINDNLLIEIEAIAVAN
ncbi:RidA family protein [Bacillus cereus]|nr:RidA family protein [Bacillus cereus]